MGEVPTEFPVKIETKEEDGEYFLDYIGGRKFIFAMLAITFGFVLVLTGKTEADTWFRFTEIIGATYIIGNVVSKYIK